MVTHAHNLGCSVKYIFKGFVKTKFPIPVNYGKHYINTFLGCGWGGGGLWQGGLALSFDPKVWGERGIDCGARFPGQWKSTDYLSDMSMGNWRKFGSSA